MSTPNAVSRVGIVAPMPEELAPLEQATTIGTRLTEAGHTLVTGQLEGTPVVLVRTGDGPVQARAGAEALLDRCAVDVLLVVGVAGGLDPSLAPEDVLVAAEIRSADGHLAPAPDPTWRAAAEAIDGVRPGTLVTASTIVTDPDEKAALWACLPHHRPAAVDMESVAYADVAAAYGVPYLILRAISDVASNALPSYLPACQNEDGSINRGRVMRKAMWAPGSIGTLLQMQRRVSACAERLARVVQALL